jgi:hypothetical protein
VWLGFEIALESSSQQKNTTADMMHNAEEILDLISNKSAENDLN